MQIVLFDDKKTMKLLPRDFGLCCSKKCVIRDSSIDKVKERLNELRLSTEDKNRLLGKDRKYETILGMKNDSHFLIESMGVTTTSKNYVYILSIENCLDAVLSVITGCSASSIRRMEDYDRISKTLLTLDLDGMNIELNQFFNLDSNLDEYLDKIEQPNEIEFMKFFYSCILNYITEVLKYVGFYMQYNLSGVMFKSIRNGKIIICSDTDLQLDSLEVINSSDNNIFSLMIEKIGVVE